jgi:hypothetical protein
VPGADEQERRGQCGVRWITQYASRAETLAWLRIIYAASALVVFVPLSAVSLGGAPAGFYFAPLGPMALLDGYPSHTVLIAAEVAARVALVFLLVGLRTRAAGITFGVLEIFLAGVRYSSGKIDHDLLMLSIVPIVMSFSAWGTALAFDARTNPERESPRLGSAGPVALVALATGFTFFTSSWWKAVTGWLTPDGSATHAWMQYYVSIGQGHWINERLVTWDLPFMWKGLDWATLLFEGVFLLFIWRRNWLRWFLLVAIGFHIGTVVLMSIDFSRLLVAYLIIGWADAAVPAGITRRADGVFDRLRPWRWPLTIAAAALYALVFAARGAPSVVSFFPTPPLNLGTLVLGGAFVALLVYQLRHIGYRPQGGPTSLQPAWLLVAAVILVAPLAVFWQRGELFPAVEGPLFMGNRETGGQILVTKPVITVDGAEITPSEFTGLPEPFATNVVTMRFPKEPTSIRGAVEADQSRLDELEDQGHKLGPEPYHPPTMSTLSPAEAEWMGKRGGAEIEWVAEYWRNGELVSTRPLNQYVLES